MAATLNSGHLDDLTATRLCAEAMGLEGLHPIEEVCPILKDGTVRSALVEKDWGDDTDAEYYDPLHDDAQLLSMARKFPYEFEESVREWCNHLRRNESYSLNYDFVFRVAKLRGGKDGV